MTNAQQIIKDLQEIVGVKVVITLTSEKVLSPMKLDVAKEMTASLQAELGLEPEPIRVIIRT